MSKEELRRMKRGINTTAGDAKKELEQIIRLQEMEQVNDNIRSTITVGCSGVLTLFCCP